MKRNRLILLTTLLAACLIPAALSSAKEAPVAHDDTHGAVTQAQGAGHGAEPQLLQPPEQGLVTALTALIVFALLLVVLGKYAWGPIASGLKAREDKIRRDIADAEEARAKAEATLRDYNQKLASAEAEVRAIMGRAASDAERVATSLRMKAQQEAEEIKERAQRDIEATKDQALSEIYEKVAELSTSIAEKILRKNINVEDQRDLVRQSLRQLQDVG